MKDIKVINSEIMKRFLILMFGFPDDEHVFKKKTMNIIFSIY